jgi:hypothetical protein
MAALSLEVLCTAGASSEPVALSSNNDPLQPAGQAVTARSRSRSHALDLSRSRTHDAALDILKAYKLSGNFHFNLDTVLKDMGVFEMITYRVEPHPVLDFSDRRRATFTGGEHVPDAVFDGFIASIKTRIGFDTPLWVRQLRRLGHWPYGQSKCAAMIIEKA